MLPSARRPRKEIPLETVRGWLPEWKALGVRHVALTGGEARMHIRRKAKGTPPAAGR
jgi:molybdenum cofactor biosynthesis enzyme MoaA